MNALHAIAYAVDGLIMLALPVALAFFLAKRYGARWNTWLLGMLAFISSQVVHLPLVIGIQQFAKGSRAAGGMSGTPALIVNAVLLGLAAGICEELARWLFLRYVAKHARAWRDGMMFGAGHGGIEAIILGSGVLMQIGSMAALTPAVIATLPADQQPVVAQQVQAFWSAPLWQIQLGWVERIFALCIHLACTLLVLEAVRRRQMVFLFGAILWHALTDGLTVVASPLGVAGTEGVVAVLALASFAIVWLMRRRDTAEDRRVSDEAPSRSNPRGTLQPPLRQPDVAPEEGYASPHLANDAGQSRSPQSPQP